MFSVRTGNTRAKHSTQATGSAKGYQAATDSTTDPIKTDWNRVEEWTKRYKRPIDLGKLVTVVEAMEKMSDRKAEIDKHHKYDTSEAEEKWKMFVLKDSHMGSQEYLEDVSRRAVQAEFLCIPYYRELVALRFNRIYTESQGEASQEQAKRATDVTGAITRIERIVSDDLRSICMDLNQKSQDMNLYVHHSHPDDCKHGSVDERENFLTYGRNYGIECSALESMSVAEFTKATSR